MSPFNLDQIRQFWTRQALDHGQDSSASWSDKMVIEMEIREILRHLSDGDRVLDVGCANGYSTLQFAAHRRIEICGLDYIPEMIEHAQQRLAALKECLEGSAEFHVGDVTALAQDANTFDKVICVRVIINLGEPDRQTEGLRECARVLKPGGKLLLSEASVQGWRRLNRLRTEWGLPDIPMPPFNRYLDESQVIQALEPELKMIDLVNFASSYYVGTRVLKPLLAQACGADIDVADPNMEWNRWCSGWQPSGDYGTQKLFIFEKQ